MSHSPQDRDTSHAHFRNHGPIGTLSLMDLRHSPLSLAAGFGGVGLASVWLTWRMAHVPGALYPALALLAFLILAVPVLVFLTPAYRFFPAWKDIRVTERTLIDVPLPLPVLEEAKRLITFQTALTALLCTVLLTAILGAEEAVWQHKHVTIWSMLVVGLLLIALLGIFSAGNRVLARRATQLRAKVQALKEK